jgi:hypothetical protein
MSFFAHWVSAFIHDPSELRFSATDYFQTFSDKLTLLQRQNMLHFSRGKGSRLFHNLFLPIIKKIFHAPHLKAASKKMQTKNTIFSFCGFVFPTVFCLTLQDFYEFVVTQNHPIV